MRRAAVLILAAAALVAGRPAAADSIEVFVAAMGGANHEFGLLTPTQWRLHAGHGAAAGVDWHLTRHFSAEVMSGNESESVRVSGTRQGSFHVIPNAAVFQYHPVTDALVEPYIGVGVSYLMFRGNRATPFGRFEQPDHAALMTQAGLDYVASSHWRLMFGAEYGPARSTAEVTHATARTEKIDFHQLYLATGLRYRF
jgi:outer membrane protein W